MRVLAAMSGGVDSAVAAARAAEQGHDVTGIHLALSRNPKSYRTGARGCCTIEDANDARRAADVIGIPFYVWDLSERFHEDVVEDFLSEYAEGRTPNPCLRCNEKIKFAAVLDRAVALGFDAVVTGHYAQLRTDPDGLIEMHRAEDMSKDQSYVLGVLTQEQLAHSMFPLGDTPKSEIRLEAERRGLAVAAKPDSHDICFISDGDTGGWLSEKLLSRSTAAGPSSPTTARCSGRTRVPGATRSGSGAACASGPLRPTGSRATCSTSSPRPAPSPWVRVPPSLSTGSRRSGRAGAARSRRRRWSAPSSCVRTATSTVRW